MLETIWYSVNRVTKNKLLLGEDERIAPLDAIKEGKLADLIILDKNPLKVNPMDIKDIKILETIKEGNSIFKI
ncbi:amidohydrolase family protein [Paraclostridium tenue]|uniref:amidohydrolase family protein n=1 Tax=Paeniclostridium hominis TaxID=2764329 RepID=UPI001FAC2A07|nr:MULTISPECIES: amidohydrolase family protein [Paeniclostridium]